MAFYFWTKPFGACKKKEKQDQIKKGWYQDIWLKPKDLTIFPKVNNQRWPRILQKSLIFMHPKSTQISIDHQKLGTRKKPLKIIQNQA
jgi:hypothetical protein